ncbi:hypothetical protein Taro_044513 [Colocasia esculenta]|uniref:Uncharacterized protein n=1 Tax=Colocasia esculenta TaxID=4460 RepID=A0A843X2V8_COLES|nr:hypothetical protein [Colocasia esculenta]
MGRRPCCSKVGLNRGAWSAHEDQILTNYIKTHGEGKWRDLPEKAGLKRCGKSCRLRWLNYLRPDIKRGNITPEEEDLIIRLHNLLGNRWSLIAGRLPGRTDNEIKNHWNTNLSKRVQAASCRPDIQEHGKKPQKSKAASGSPPMASTITQSAIRTKPRRCTKGLLPPAPFSTTAPAMGIPFYNRNTLATPAPQDGDPLDFLKDFDMEDLMSDVQELGLTEGCIGGGIRRFINSNNDDEEDHLMNGGDMSSHTSSPRQRLFLFEEGVLEDWRDYIQHSAVADITGLDSYQEAAGLWQLSE